MEYREFDPHPALKPYVENFWLMSGISSCEQVIVPDGNTGLMFVGNGVFRSQADGQGFVDMSGRAVVVGQKSRPARYRFGSTDRFGTFGVRFRPAGLAVFTGISPVSLVDRVVAAESLFGPESIVADNNIRNAKQPATMVYETNRLLLRCFKGADPRQQIAEQMAGMIFRKHGHYQAEHWVRHFGISERQIERLFRQYIGLRPKTFARIVRFNHSIVQHNYRPQQRMTDLAYATGYYDQMHFIKEVKAFTRQTPKTYFQGHPGSWSGILKNILSKHFGSQNPALG
ncbi:MAG: AraC family transcriptional regulator [Lewinellaceae bacterium]|nr:AraC family transcriptional regulator [Lewinellaceae bacterium]